MIDKNTAKKLVAEHINANYYVNEDMLVVLEQETIDKEYGWIFFYDSKKFLRTQDYSFAVAGNGPIVVEKIDGTLHQLSTALPPDECVKEYEKTRNR